MKGKTVMRVIAAFAFLALVVSGVWAAGGGGETTASTGDGKPQYGGTITYDIGGNGNEPPSPDIGDAQFDSLRWREHVLEHPLMGDFETFGPRGNNEYPFQEFAYVPAKYLKGHLLESFEVTHEKLVWNVRPGIFWAPNEDQRKRGVMKEPRELTADDMAADIIEFIESPWRVRFEGIADSSGVKVIDKYTLEIEFINFSPMLNYYLGFEDRSIYGPPETAAAGPERYENHIGTGAYMFEEYIAGSHMSYIRNPDYWGTTIIDGEEYQLPFIERVVGPIIPDASTRVAALRTGTFDLVKSKQLPFEFVDSLKEVEGLVYVELKGASDANYVNFRCNEPPFDNADLRRALMVGTNLDEFEEIGMSPASPPWFPTLPWNPAYVPLDELPEEDQILFNYDPELAKEMLADAGYPDGLKMQFSIEGSQPITHDRAALLKDQWSKIGVDVEIVALEPTEYIRQRYPVPEVSYHGAINGTYISADPLNMLDQMCRSTGGLNYSNYSNPEVDEVIQAALFELDPDKQLELVKQANKMVIADAQVIPLYYERGAQFYWPWVKNYFGEASIQDDNCFAQIVYHMWIDQDLKKEMGF
jgi:peptide/nickel transport system substrate-binding protein